jgi:hypothetical protein
LHPFETRSSGKFRIKCRKRHGLPNSQFQISSILRSQPMRASELHQHFPVRVLILPNRQLRKQTECPRRLSLIAARSTDQWRRSNRQGNWHDI